MIDSVYPHHLYKETTDLTAEYRKRHTKRQNPIADPDTRNTNKNGQVDKPRLFIDASKD